MCRQLICALGAYPTTSREISQSAYQMCQAFRERIAGYYSRSGLTPALEAFCYPVAGEAALLLVQASTTAYPPPTLDDSDTERWLKTRLRLLAIHVESTDDSMKLYLK